MQLADSCRARTRRHRVQRWKNGAILAVRKDARRVSLYGWHARAASAFWNAQSVLRGCNSSKDRGVRISNELAEWVHRPDSIDDDWDPWTRRIARLLRAQRVTPIAAEVPIFDLDSRVYSRIDLVCETASGKTLLVEIKTGYRLTNPRRALDMEHLLGIKDTGRNRGLLQILYYEHLVRMHHPDCHTDRALLIHINDHTGIQVMDAHADWKGVDTLRLQTEMHRCLVETAHRRRHSKPKEPRQRRAASK